MAHLNISDENEKYVLSFGMNEDGSAYMPSLGIYEKQASGHNKVVTIWDSSKYLLGELYPLLKKVKNEEELNALENKELGWIVDTIPEQDLGLLLNIFERAMNFTWDGKSLFTDIV